MPEGKTTPRIQGNLAVPFLHTMESILLQKMFIQVFYVLECYLHICQKRASDPLELVTWAPCSVQNRESSMAPYIPKLGAWHYLRWIPHCQSVGNQMTACLHSLPP